MWTVRNSTPCGVHRDCCRPRGPTGYYLRSSRGIYPILTRRTTATTPLLVRLAAWEERYSGVDEGCVLSTPRSAGEEHASLSLPAAKARGAKKSSEASTTKRDRGPTSEVSMPFRIPGNKASLFTQICCCAAPPCQATRLSCSSRSAH